jgi:hypothetical protein
MEFPKETEIDAHDGYLTEDGFEVDYRVFERTPPPSNRALEVSGWVNPFFSELDHQNNESAVSTLMIDPGSVVVHHVNWVKYKCTPHKVVRSRHQKHVGTTSVEVSDEF